MMFAPSVDHPSLPELLNVIEAPHGPMLVYEWVPGELLGVERSRRADPATSFQRFRALPLSDLITRLDVVFDFHRSAAELGWVAVDFYDGAMIYDFATQAMRLIDLDHYRDRPFTEAGPAQMSLAEELSGIETLFLGAHVSVSRELGLAPDTAMGSDTSASEGAERFVAWARELKSDPDLNLDLRTMVPVFYDVGRRKPKVWAFLGWSRRPITVSFARPPQATIRDLNGRLLRNHPPIRWGALHADLQYPVTAELYVDRILNRDEFRKVCDSCCTRSEILRRLDASTNPT
jgi:hypothetical protein